MQKGVVSHLVLLALWWWLSARIIPMWWYKMGAFSFIAFHKRFDLTDINKHISYSTGYLFFIIGIWIYIYGLQMERITNDLLMLLSNPNNSFIQISSLRIKISINELGKLTSSLQSAFIGFAIICVFYRYIINHILKYEEMPLYFKKKIIPSRNVLNTIKFASYFLFGITVFFLFLIEIMGNTTNVFTYLSIVGTIIAFIYSNFFANLWGGFIIFTKKPFQIGDEIVLVDRQKDVVKGIVENITWRFTTIRGSDEGYIPIANSVVGNMILRNYSKLTFKLSDHIRIKKQSVLNSKHLKIVANRIVLKLSGIQEIDSRKIMCECESFGFWVRSDFAIHVFMDKVSTPDFDDFKEYIRNEIINIVSEYDPEKANRNLETV
ncbi:MAG: mechanosensitive ion channel [Rickettsiales bacterium]|nr:mechanosensitive ion channel [Rickettsiales bacterium]